MARHVKYQKGFNLAGAPAVWEVYGRRRWQTEWTHLRNWHTEQMAKADVQLTKNRIFNDKEKALMRGAN